MGVKWAHGALWGPFLGQTLQHFVVDHAIIMFVWKNDVSHAEQDSKQVCTDFHRTMNPQFTQICRPNATRSVCANEKERFHQNLLKMLYIWCIIIYTTKLLIRYN